MVVSVLLLPFVASCELPISPICIPIKHDLRNFHVVVFLLFAIWQNGRKKILLLTSATMINEIEWYLKLWNTRKLWLVKIIHAMHPIDSKYCHHMNVEHKIEEKKKLQFQSKAVFFPSDLLEGLSLCYAKFQTLCSFWCLVFGKKRITKIDGKKKLQQSDHES